MSTLEILLMPFLSSGNAEGVQACNLKSLRGVKIASRISILLFQCLTMLHECAEARFKGTGWTFMPPSADTMLQCVDRALGTRYAPMSCEGRYST